MYWNWCMILLCQSSFKCYQFGEDQHNFWTAYGGQRSKNGHFGLNLPFSVIFFVLVTEFALELVYVIAMSTICHVLPVEKKPE